MTAHPETVDALIIGAGPAGLSAATELRRQGGGQVVVLEREATAGGIPRHCLHSPYGLREWKRLMFGPAYAKRLVQEAKGAGVEIRCQTTVTALHPGGEVDVSAPDGPRRIRGRVVLLALGARETPRAARLIGGTKPGGVMNTATLQSFAAFSKHRPFHRPVILGTELVAFSALLTCRTLGARPVAMLEPGPEITARGVFAAAPRALGVPLYRNTRITAIHGRAQVDGITVESNGVQRDIACDGVVVTGGFRPENALLRAAGLALDPGSLGPRIDQYGRLTDPAYFSAGNVLHPIETAGWCWEEGRRVARCMAAALNGALPPRDTAEPLAVDGVTQGDALAYALPQELCAPAPQVPPAFDRVQMRLRQPFSGQVRVAGQSHWIASRPERRITLPLHPTPEAE
ncbi:NAD(P)/FAD-dependent oxidoreductase [Meridianimarinicoccus sp. MJW13]|uniref:NAD(P)/FAD-dependent oxidoreductase n=1 Tax=Meridianimarinicoccus sp. MJW13 TaxID=2720031 RepID=UPI0018673D2F|nr:FAD-dependent oxidoreductase [Fluviibacterium sp. MJW13]